MQECNIFREFFFAVIKNEEGVGIIKFRFHIFCVGILCQTVERKTFDALCVYLHKSVKDIGKPLLVDHIHAETENSTGHRKISFSYF